MEEAGSERNGAAHPPVDRSDVDSAVVGAHRSVPHICFAVCSLELVDTFGTNATSALNEPPASMHTSAGVPGTSTGTS